MQIIEEITPEKLTLRLSGRFDAHETPQVRQKFTEHAPKNALIDLSGVTFLDSAALSTLVQAMKNCRERGGELTLANMPQPVRIIFELTRLDKAFNIVNAPDAP
ncbi:MAG: STAS domain-containing protein [Anaerolineae bacterium]|nr:STAS domain-containing protein [Anaerolineae bacterium]